MNPNMLSLIRAVPALGALLLAVPTGAAFIDNLNGTVTDDQTGLMWDKCLQCMFVISNQENTLTP